ncbi:hypothetical protein [Methylobacterium sp. NFXW15]|uniref:hypothetical protein n=1 Tax=Methylobacterium sp. NFXW15 TaxID=2819512 RepID=UPI003CEC12CF
MFRSLFLGAVCVGLGVASAQARSTRSASADQPVVQETSSVRPVAVIENESQPVCTHTRRRLWLEGEGWVVRKIATCR